MQITYILHAQDNFTLKGKVGNAGTPGKAFLLYRDGHEHVEERRQWLAELRELRRTMEAQGSLLQRLTERPLPEDPRLRQQ